MWKRRQPFTHVTELNLHAMANVLVFVTTRDVDRLSDKRPMTLGIGLRIRRRSDSAVNQRETVFVSEYHS